MNQMTTDITELPVRSHFQTVMGPLCSQLMERSLIDLSVSLTSIRPRAYAELLRTVETGLEKES